MLTAHRCWAVVNKASQLRRLTRNWGIHAKQEEVEVDIKELLSKNLTRPLRILFTEPIVLLVTIYMSFVCKHINTGWLYWDRRSLTVQPLLI